MNTAPDEPRPLASPKLHEGGPVSPKPREGGWSLRRWVMLIVLVFAAQIALIFAFGERKPITPRAVTNVPELKLATTNSEEWLALNNPTLFAQPNRRGFAGPAWLEPPPTEFHQLEWTEPPRWLLLPVGELGSTFDQFMQTNRFTAFQFESKPPARFAAPVLPGEPALAKTSTLRIEGGLVRRPLLTPMKLPSWPYADVITPSKVQVLVDAAGNVVSAVVLPSDNPLEAASHYDAADRRALELARAARFAPLSPKDTGIESNPASRLTIGRLIFNWHIVAPPATNTPAGS
jgi:hypothetical protein